MASCHQYSVGSTLAPHLLLLVSFLLLRGVEAPEAAATAELLFLCWTLRTNQR